MSYRSDPITALTAGLRRSEDFPRAAAAAVRRLQEAGCPLAAVSVYLVDADGRHALHYYLHPLPVGSERVPVDLESELFRPLRTGQVETWRDRGQTIVSLPGHRGVVTVSQEPADDHPLEVDGTRLADLVQALELLCLRHRDLSAAEALAARVSQADESLAALYDGSLDLSGRTPRQVANKVIGLVQEYLGLDRAGLFLREADVLRGAWGVDEEGRVVPIGETVFELHPEDEAQVTEAALIARGELEYFLSQDLDAEGHESIEGDIGASVSVPMAVGRRIIGVLAADTNLSRDPVDPALLRPLMILANQAAAALEHARLYDDLHEASVHLERRVEERTAELSRANADKELLLKEVYHRTKNNLQLVVSMLSLQAGHLDDPGAVRALEECRDRIHAMSAIHEDLYAAADLRAIDFSRHVHALVSRLLESYQIAPGAIHLRLEADYLLLGIDAAIPLSLVVNELVTNCLKYAFPDGRSGTLEIGLRIQGPDVCLDVGDDGGGLPEGFDLASVSTMGLQIATALVSQLRGSIEVDLQRERGAGFHILLPGLATIAD